MLPAFYFLPAEYLQIHDWYFSFREFPVFAFVNFPDASAASWAAHFLPALCANAFPVHESYVFPAEAYDGKKLHDKHFSSFAAAV